MMRLASALGRANQPENAVNFEAISIEALNLTLSSVIDGCGAALYLIAVAQYLVTFIASFCVVNRIDQSPVYLFDTYLDGAPKDAVQRFIDSTHLLNPLCNAFLQWQEAASRGKSRH
jgi:hypothetical protein